MIDKKVILLFYFVVSNICNAQYFNNNYDISINEDFLVTPVYKDSFLYVNGAWINGSDIGTLFAKIDLNGDTVFTKKYIKDSCRYGTGITMIEKNGYLYSLGSYRKPPSYQYKACIYKVTLNCDTVAMHELDTLNGVFYHSLAFTRNSKIIVTGNSNTISTNYNILLLKMDTLLNPLWIKTYGGGNEDVGLSVDTTSDGGFVIGGYTHSYGAGFGDAYLIKTDSLGVFQWQKTYGGIYDGDFGRVKVFNGNEIIFYGSKELNPITIPANSDQELFIRKYYNNGILISENLDIINHPLIVTNNLILSSNFYYFNYYYFNIDSNFVVTEIIKTDTLGNLLYSTDYTRTRSDNYSTNMIMLPDKSLVTSGYLFPDGISLMSEDGWLFRVDSMGCFIPGCVDGVLENNLANTGFGLTCYPNPSENIVNIEVIGLENDVNGYIYIIDLTGKTIQSFIINDEYKTLTVAGLSTGMYQVVYVQDKAVIAFEKIIITK